MDFTEALVAQLILLRDFMMKQEYRLKLLNSLKLLVPVSF